MAASRRWASPVSAYVMASKCALMSSRVVASITEKARSIRSLVAASCSSRMVL